MSTPHAKEQDWYWPEYCELTDSEDKPCEGRAMIRARAPEVEREVYICEAHFGRLFRHLGRKAIDRLRI